MGLLNGKVAEAGGYVPESTTPENDLEALAAGLPREAPPREPLFEPSGFKREHFKTAYTNTTFDSLFAEAEDRHGLPRGTLKPIAVQESAFRPDIIEGRVKSSTGAVGLMQFMPETAKKFGVTDPTDPAQSIEGAASYMAKLVNMFDGDLSLAYAAYHAGEGNVQNLLKGKKNGVGPKTRMYAQNAVDMFNGTAQADEAPIETAPTPISTPAPVKAPAPTKGFVDWDRVERNAKTLGINLLEAFGAVASKVASADANPVSRVATPIVKKLMEGAIDEHKLDDKEWTIGQKVDAIDKDLVRFSAMDIDGDPNQAKNRKAIDDLLKLRAAYVEAEWNLSKWGDAKQFAKQGIKNPDPTYAGAAKAKLEGLRPSEYANQLVRGKTAADLKAGKIAGNQLDSSMNTFVESQVLAPFEALVRESGFTGRADKLKDYREDLTNRAAAQDPLVKGNIGGGVYDAFHDKDGNLTVKDGDWSGLVDLTVEAIAAGAPQTAASIGAGIAGIVTKNPERAGALLASWFGLSSKLKTEEQGLAMGLDPETARKRAYAFGAMEGGSEYLPFGIAGSFAKKFATLDPMARGAFVKKLMYGAAAVAAVPHIEGTEEWYNQVGQDLYDSALAYLKETPLAFKEKVASTDILANANEAYGQGSVGAAGFAAVVPSMMTQAAAELDARQQAITGLINRDIFKQLPDDQLQGVINTARELNSLRPGAIDLTRLNLENSNRLRAKGDAALEALNNPQTFDIDTLHELAISAATSAPLNVDMDKATNDLSSLVPDSLRALDTDKLPKAAPEVVPLEQITRYHSLLKTGPGVPADTAFTQDVERRLGADSVELLKRSVTQPFNLTFEDRRKVAEILNPKYNLGGVSDAALMSMANETVMPDDHRAAITQEQQKRGLIPTPETATENGTTALKTGLKTTFEQPAPATSYGQQLILSQNPSGTHVVSGPLELLNAVQQTLRAQGIGSAKQVNTGDVTALQVSKTAPVEVVQAAIDQHDPFTMPEDLSAPKTTKATPSDVTTPAGQTADLKTLEEGVNRDLLKQAMSASPGSKAATLRPYRLVPVEEKALPKSVPAMTKLGVRLIAKAFGKRVVYIADANGQELGFHGVYGGTIGGNTNTLYLDANGTPILTRVVGHEILHALRTQAPDIYNTLEEALSPMLDARHALPANQSRDGRPWAERGSHLKEESIADLIGDEMVKPSFWLQLASPMTHKLATRFFETVLDKIDRVIGAFTGQPLSRESQQTFKQARNAVVTAMGDYKARVKSGGIQGATEEVKYAAKEPRNTDNIKKRTLAETLARIPEKTRVVSADISKTLEGQSFDKLNPQALGHGFLYLQAEGSVKANEKLSALMARAAETSGLPKTEAAKIQIPDAAFFDKAFRLPDEARYWYERSALAFTKQFFAFTNSLVERLIDIVAATSGGQTPYWNLRNAIAAMSQQARHAPVTVGTRDPKSLSQGLSEDPLGTHKFGSFANTMQAVAELRGEKPLPTIDLRISQMFGLDHGPDVASDPRMYETLARFFIALRDLQNSYLPAGAQPYESWQLQALSWVEIRGTEDPDDYGARMVDVLDVLKEAGIPLEDGKVGERTLQDPRTSEVLAPTTKLFGTRTATLETKTTLTEEGALAASVYAKIADLEAPWAKKARAKYWGLQRKSMRELGFMKAKKPSVLSKLFSAVLGRSAIPFRIDVNALGTFEGHAAPNIRIPLVASATFGKETIRIPFTPEKTDSKTTKKFKDLQRNYILAVLGKDFSQAGSAASQFTTVPDGTQDTYTIFVENYGMGDISLEALEALDKQLGFPVSYQKLPNGWLIDVNIGGFDTKPTALAVQTAARTVLGADAVIELIPRAYASDYLTPEADWPGALTYDKAISAFEKEIRNATQHKNTDPGGGGRSRNPESRLRDLLSARQQIQEIAATQSRAEAEWVAEVTGNRNYPKYSKKQVADLFADDFADENTTHPVTRVISSKTGQTETYQLPNVNSEGKVIAHTKQALANFWNWFEGSAVVDDAGQPLVMYHGTGADFNTFKQQASRNSNSLGGVWEVNRSGFFFTENKAFAEDFSKSYTASGALKQEGAMMPVYLDIKDPVDFTKGLSESVENALEANGYNTRLLSFYGEDWELFDSTEDNDQGAALVKALIASGYDGAIINEEGPQGLVKVYIAFYPNQIKSAIGNSGAFSNTTGDIRYKAKELTEDQGQQLVAKWTAFAHHMEDSLYRYPRSEAEDLKTITKDVSGGRATAMDVSGWFDDRPEGEKTYRIEIPKGVNTTQDTFMTQQDNTVWINVASLNEGSGGSLVYSIVGNYAYNNGLRFIADPAGISESGQIRRLVNMLSLATKFNNTDFLRPHQRQLDNLRELGFDWRQGDFAYNLHHMLVSVYNSTLSFVPEIENVDYNFETGEFTKNGEPYTTDDFERAAKTIHGDLTAGAPGSGTLKTGAVIGSLLRQLDGRGVPQTGLGSAESLRAGIKGVLYSAKPSWYYSQLAKSLETQPNRIFEQPAKQLAVWLQANTAKLGVKQDELQWSGVTDWLELQGKAKVPKADVLAFLEQNGVEVRDVTLKEPDDLENYYRRDFHAYGYDLEYDRVAEQFMFTKSAEGPAEEVEFDELPQTLQDMLMETPGPVLFGKNFRGGVTLLEGPKSDYTELLLSLPDRRKEALVKENKDLTRLIFGTFGASDEATVKSASAKLDANQLEIARRNLSNTYTSGHFESVTNPLAHIRFDTRKSGSDKVLFIEELQSDWAQKGRKEGFFAPLTEAEVRRRYGDKSYDELSIAKKSMVQNIYTPRKQDSAAVPSAPFVQDTEAWVALVLKRVIAYAVDNKFDKIAWTTGEQQADRYNLSTQIKSISYSAYGDGFFEISTTLPNGQEFRPASGRMDLSAIEATFGKDIAKKISETRDPDTHTLEGDNLVVGGEGMAAFYDKLVPRVANALLKKLGGGRLETIPIFTKETVSGGRKWTYSIYWPEDNTAVIVKADDPTYATVAGPFKGSAAQTQAFDWLHANDPALATDQQGFSITPEMKAAVEKGLPLFARKANLTGSRFALPEETKGDTFTRHWQNDVLRWKQQVEAIRERGGVVNDGNNVYQAMERMLPRAMEASLDFYNDTVEPVLKEMHKADITLEDIGEFLYAGHAKERNLGVAAINPAFANVGYTEVGGSGWSDQRADQTLAKYWARPDATKFEAFARKFRSWAEANLNAMVAGGLISQEQAAAMRAKYPNYVPLRGFADISEIDEMTGLGSGFSTPKSVVKRALGRASEAMNPAVYIIHNVLEGFVAKGKAEVGGYLDRLVQDNPDPLLWGGTSSKSPVFINNAQGGTVSNRDMGFDPEREARFIKDGQEVRIPLRDPLLARAYNNLGSEELGAVLRGSRAINNFLRSMWVEKNPVFPFVNIGRDVQSATLYVTGERGASVAATMLKDLPGAWYAMLQHSMTRKVSGPMQKWVTEYRAQGGGTGYRLTGDVQATADKIKASQTKLGELGVWEALLKGRPLTAGQRAVWKLYNNGLMTFVSHISSAFENATRLAVYKALRERGYSPAEAARVSKNATINFNRRGEKSQQVSSLYLFFNVGVQNVAKDYSTVTHSEHKGQARAILAAFATLGFIMGMLPDGGDDPDKEGLTDESEHARAIKFTVGEIKAAIPLAYGAIGFAYYLGRTAAKVVKGESILTSSIRLTSSLLANVSPINPIPNPDRTDAKNATVALTPTALQLPMQLVMNRGSFGQDIMPDYRPKDPNVFKTYRGTKGSLYQTIAEWMSEKTGGDTHVGGVVDVSPEQIKAVVHYVFGGTGKFLTDTGSTGADLLEGEANINHMPLVNRFVRTLDETDYRNRFYREAGEAKDALELYNKYAEDNDAAKATPLETQAQLGHVARGMWEQMNALRDQELQINKDGTLSKTERKRQIDELRSQQITLSNEFHRLRLSTGQSLH